MPRSGISSRSRILAGTKIAAAVRVARTGNPSGSKLTEMRQATNATSSDTSAMNARPRLNHSAIAVPTTSTVYGPNTPKLPSVVENRWLMTAAIPAMTSTAAGMRSALSSSRNANISGRPGIRAARWRTSSLALCGLVGTRFFADHAAQDVFQFFLCNGLPECFVDQRLVAAAAGARTKVLDDRHVEIHRQPGLAARRRLAISLLGAALPAQCGARCRDA